LHAAIEGNSKPVIVAINGGGFGGDFEIALACDMIATAQSAKWFCPKYYSIKSRAVVAH
jgi:enoyl-CoA hydratase/carnithine racemase